MCGRATLVVGAEEIASLFEVAPRPVGPPRFNIAPSQDLVIVRPLGGGGSRELTLVRWGLVPWWSTDGKARGTMSQARAETVDRAPAFRDAFQHRRCLVVVDGFYEWSGAGKARRPHHVALEGGRPFALAGLWERWTSPEGATLETCAVVTTAARGALAAVHDRMPLLLAESDHGRWLSAAPEGAKEVLRGGDDPPLSLRIRPVSTWVNDVRHDDPRCLEGGPEPAQTTLRFG
jgi:putative SOS response-associated peptidase YedK